jgi:hypothetical protein
MPCMKLNPWLFPGLALVAGGLWIGSQKNTAHALEQEITTIRERILQAREMENTDANAEGKAASEKGKKVDWKDIAGKIRHANGHSMPDMREMIRLQKFLLEMSPEQLAAQFDELTGLEMEDSARQMLQSIVIAVLVEKDPKFALERFGNQSGDQESAVYWQLSHALGRWAEREPAAASAWLDQQIAGGKFESKSLDGKSEPLLRIERGLVEALLKKNPVEASARVKALPESQLEDFFKNGIQVEPENEQAYAKLVRECVPADKIGGILAETAELLSHRGDYERVDGFIAHASATDEEKNTIVAQVIKNHQSMHGEDTINVEAMDKARAWGAKQSPGAVDKATGEALTSNIWEKGNFEKASKLALKYNEASSNDEVLGTFLKSHQVQQQDEAKRLIDRIKDPILREEIRNLPEYKK